VSSSYPVTGAQPGRTVPLWAYVTNTGSTTLPAGTSVWFYVNGPSFTSWTGSVSVAGLAPGAGAFMPSTGLRRFDEPGHLDLGGPQGFSILSFQSRARSDAVVPHARSNDR
jgi:hypothetical protein